MIWPVIATAQISATGITGVWNNPVNGWNVSGAGTNKLSWGGTSSQFKSSYTFTAQPVIFPVQLGQPFALGTYVHSNRVIPIGSGITAVAFDGTVSLNVNGTAVNNLAFAYNFLHDETPNISGTCPPGTSVCSDLVTITNNGSIQDNFTVNGLSYTLTILGFEQNGVIFNQLSTPENQTNTALLMAILTAGDPISVPEPSTYLLLGSSLGLILMFRRRRPLTMN